MIKDNKGISLIMLVISFVIMILLISIIVNTSLNSVEEVETVKIEDEIRNLTDAVNDRIINNERNSIQYPLVGSKVEEDVFLYIRSIKTLDSSEITKIISKINENYSDKTKDLFRLVGNIEAQRLGVKNVDPDHYYIVDYNTGDVYGPVTNEYTTGEW